MQFVATFLFLILANIFNSGFSLAAEKIPDFHSEYVTLEKDFKANPNFKVANTNRYRNKVRSSWNYPVKVWTPFSAPGGQYCEYQADPLPTQLLLNLIEFQMLDEKVYQLARKGMERILKSSSLPPALEQADIKVNPDLLVVINFDLHGQDRRLFVFDLKEKKVLFNTWVGHAKKSDTDGDGFPDLFSNKPGSQLSSPGFFVTDSKTFMSDYGYSFRVHGIDGELNSNAFSRGILFHPNGNMTAINMSMSFDSAVSEGCFMLPYFESGRFYGLEDLPLSTLIEDKIKNGVVVYVHNSDLDLEKVSRWLRD